MSSDVATLDPCCEHLWGKFPEADVPYPLVAHLLDTTVTIGWLWDRWLRDGLKQFVADAIAGGDLSRARRLVQALGGLHDVGKANPVFQVQAASRATNGSWVTRLRERLVAAGLPLLSGEAAETVGLLAVRRHEVVGFAALTGGMYPAAEALVAEHWFPTVVGGHHGYWWTDQSRQAEAETVLGSMLVEPWMRQIGVHVVEVLGVVGADRADWENPLSVPPVPVVLVLSGLVILADWLASHDEVVAAGRARLERFEVMPDGATWLDAVEGGNSRTMEVEDWCERLIPPLASLTGLRASTLGGRSPRPLQEALEACAGTDGLVVAMYPTGEGKTEAALLRHGDRAEGLLFTLPTQATTNAMEERLSHVFGVTGNPVYLSHGAAAARDQIGADARSPWFSSSVRKLLAPVVAATCDQLLSSALRMKWNPLRLLAIANHHVVVDEVHTFDAYQMELLVETLYWCGLTRTRVTLLSATLHHNQLERLVVAYRNGVDGTPLSSDARMLAEVTYPSVIEVPAVPGARFYGVSTDEVRHVPDLHVEVDQVDEGGLVDAINTWVTDTRAAHPASSVGMVVNTVDRAIEIAELISATAHSETVVWCFHSRMTQAHRERVRSALLNRLGDGQIDRQMVVIGTQVMEASLDVDFDWLGSSLAPAPSLVQRAGRLWRFEDETRPSRVGDATRTLRVFVETDSDGTLTGAAPYPASELVRVREHLGTGRVLKMPDDVQTFVNTCRPATVAEFEAATAETGAQIAMAQEALHRKIPLTNCGATRQQEVDNGFTVRTVGPTWADVAAFTSMDSDDDHPATRFIDLPTATILLVDSSGTHPWAWHRTLSGPNGLTTAQVTLRDVLPYTIPVSGRWPSLLAEAHDATLTAAGLTSWAPTSSHLERLLVVDVAHFPADVDYDPDFGLRRDTHAVQRVR